MQETPGATAGALARLCGIEYIIRGRFLEAPTFSGTLMMREELDYQAVARFFREQALSLISDDLKQRS